MNGNILHLLQYWCALRLCIIVKGALAEEKDEKHCSMNTSPVTCTVRLGYNIYSALCLEQQIKHRESKGKGKQEVTGNACRTA